MSCRRVPKHRDAPRLVRSRAPKVFVRLLGDWIDTVDPIAVRVLEYIARNGTPTGIDHIARIVAVCPAPVRPPPHKTYPCMSYVD